MSDTAIDLIMAEYEAMNRMDWSAVFEDRAAGVPRAR
jgi:hypothetical protein